MADDLTSKAAARDCGDANFPKGVVLCAKADYTVPATGPGIGEKVEMVPIPEGATLLGANVSSDGGVASMTVALGDGTTADKYLAATACTAAMSAAADSGLNEVVGADASIWVTFGTAAPTEGQVYTVAAYYTMP
jgi:hypothetical protein